MARSGTAVSPRHPNAEEVDEGCRVLERLLHLHRGPFTLGRSALRKVVQLPDRFAAADRIVELWRGAPGKTAELERALLVRAKQAYGKRCTNRSLGGGPHAADAVHVLFVVLWRVCKPGRPPIAIARTPEPGFAQSLTLARPRRAAECDSEREQRTNSGGDTSRGRALH
jgi:hypothetical protein